MTRYLMDQWARSRRKLPANMPQPRWVTLVTSTMARPVIEQFAEDMRMVKGLKVQVVPVVNRFFGAEVTVAGLLCAQDVLATLEEQTNLGDLVLLPRVMLDNAGERFLDDTTVEEFKEQLPVRAEFVQNAQETIVAIRSIANTGADHRPQMRASGLKSKAN